MGRQIKIESVTYTEHQNYLMIKIKIKKIQGEKNNIPTLESPAEVLSSSNSRLTTVQAKKMFKTTKL